MKIEKWNDVHGNTTPDERMVAFLESSTDVTCFGGSTLHTFIAQKKLEILNDAG